MTRLLAFTFIFTTFSHAMEHSSETTSTLFWNIACCKTKIHLTTESLFVLHKNVDLTIIGKNTQSKLLKKHNKKYYNEKYHIVNLDDMVQPYDIGKTSTPHSIIFHKGARSVASKDATPFLEITEPCIKQRCWSDHTKHISYRTLWELWTNEKALHYASKDLARCYDIVLTEGSENLHAKTIALPTLSTKVGFPFNQAAPIAIETLVNFIINHPECYNDVYLKVKGIAEFNVYKLLLLKHCGLLHKICLFYGGHKDKDSVLTCLPHEIINCIALLV